MDLVFILFPLSAVVLSRCLVGQPPLDRHLGLQWKMAFALWVLIALTLGVVGYYIYELNEQITTTLFLLLCWLLGNGYAIASTWQFVGSVLLYAIGFLVVSIAMQQRLQTYGKFVARDFMIPSIIWGSFLVAVSVYFLVPRRKQIEI